MSRNVSRLIVMSLLSVVAAVSVLAQNTVKRNDRPQATASPAPPPADDSKKPLDPTRYSYEFKQPEFVINHVLIEHDAAGSGKITFERRSEETPIVEPIQ